MAKGFQVRGDKNNPYHLSVGAVVVKNGNVALLKKPDGSITLPRETLYSKESIENSLVRGLKEELGVIVEVNKFLGGLKEYFYRPDGTKVEKTTIYFLARTIKSSKKTPQEDELEDEVCWLNSKNAIQKLKEANNQEYKIVQKV
jgi:ADP-ribose pyrophosphatase YjhB (NUDIX family)